MYTNDVIAGVAGLVGEFPASFASESCEVNPNALELCPGCRNTPGEVATHSMAVPSNELPAPVSVGFQPVGLLVESGADGRKSSPGSQPNQNVPIVVVPVFVTVI